MIVFYQRGIYFVFFSPVFYSGEHPGSIKQRRVCDDERLRSGATGTCIWTYRVRSPEEVGGLVYTDVKLYLITYTC